MADLAANGGQRGQAENFHQPHPHTPLRPFPPTRFVLVNLSADVATWLPQSQEVLLCLPLAWGLLTAIVRYLLVRCCSRSQAQASTARPLSSITACQRHGVADGMDQRGTFDPAAPVTSCQCDGDGDSSDIPQCGFRVGLFHWVSLFLFLSAALAFFGWLFREWLSGSAPMHSLLFLGAQAATWLAVAGALELPRWQATQMQYSWAVRQWLLVCFACITVVAASSLIVRGSGGIFTDAMLAALATWPCCLLLLEHVMTGHVAGCWEEKVDGKAKDSNSKSVLHGESGEQSRSLDAAAEAENAGTAADVPAVISVDKETFLSRAAFLWLNPVLRLGAVKHLTLDDCPELGEEDHARTSYNRLTAALDRVQQREQGAAASQQGLRALQQRSSATQMFACWQCAVRVFTPSWAWREKASEQAEPLLAPAQSQQEEGQNDGGEQHSETVQDGENAQSSRQSLHGRVGTSTRTSSAPSPTTATATATPRVPSITWLLWSTFWRDITLMGMFALATTLLQYVGPLMLHVLVDFVAWEGRTAAQGVALALLLGVAKMGETLCDRQWFFGIQRTAMRMRAALVGAMLTKSLRLSSAARGRHGTGTLTNYLAVDVQRVSDFMWWLHDCWVLPLQAVLALLILANTVGLGSLGGLAAMLVSMVVQLPIARQQRSFQEKMMAGKDARMKATTEALKAMRVIKLWAWEPHFHRRLESLRGEEFTWVRANQLCVALNITLIWLCPLLVAVCTLGLCVLVGRPLSSAQVFTAIATFRVLQTPLFLMPQLLSEVSMVAVSLRRLHTLLNEDELQGYIQGQPEDGGLDDLPHGHGDGAVTSASRPACMDAGTAIDDNDVAICIRDGVFDWPEVQDEGKGEGKGRGDQSKGSGSVGAGRSGGTEGEDDGQDSRDAQGEAGGGLEAPLLGSSTEAPAEVAVAATVHKYEQCQASDADGSNGDAGSRGVDKEDGRDGGAKRGSVLQGIDMTVWRGQKVAVCGKVGSGKSSLLASILGDIPKTNGQVHVSGTTAYVPQSAWIQSGTIRSNILFGRPMDDARYAAVVRACCLQPDFDMMPKGDSTEIGERGLNLSGGQKQRVQLARAVYHDADIYLLDDPFSAVDAHTGTELFRACVLGLLADKTVVLVTHQLEFLPAVDHVLVLRDGRVVESGTYDDLRDSGLDLGSLVDAHEEAMEAVTSATSTAAASAASASGGKAGDMSVGAGKAREGQIGPDSGDEEREENVDEVESQADGNSEDDDDADGSDHTSVDDEEEGVGGGDLVEEEERERGTVSFQVYWNYLTKVRGGVYIPVIVITQFLFQGSQVAGNYWLSYATSEEGQALVGPQEFIGVYSSLALGGIVFVIVRSLMVAFTGLAAAQAFFSAMLKSILRAPMAFFDRTPSGRVLARFSSDQSTLDSDLALSFSGTLNSFSSLVAVLGVTASITPEVVLVALPLAVVFAHVQRYYLKSSRELTRITSTSKAPILNSFSESVAGAATIRAFHHEDATLDAMLLLVDVNSRPLLLSFSALEWFVLRLESMSAVVLCTTAVLLVLLPKDLVSPALVGLSLSYGLTLNISLSFFAWAASGTENRIVAVERALQYSSIQPEAPPVIEDVRPPRDWPSRGCIEIDNLKARYRDNAPLILHGVSFRVEGGQKVGIVGRTGSGKSTLVSVLFRLIEPLPGSFVAIDGVDICTIGLADLRSRLSIIPQEPTLFEGSVRANVDPLGEHSDEAIWEALDTCQLKAAVAASNKGLDAPVAESGDNWSVGQRQLFCLARALLKRSRMLVLDEATASVDSESDAVIQRTIRDNFGACTVISIAHRIPTVVDSDLVLVLDAGRVCEYASPKQLLKDPTSAFSQLVSEYAKRSTSMADLASLIRNQSRQDLSGISS